MSLFKVFCIVAIAFVVSCHTGSLIPPPDKLTADNAKCLLASKHEFTVIRGYLSDGKVDPNGVANFDAAKTGGFKAIEVSISPCLPCEPADQIKQILDAFKSETYGRIWINIGVPGWREFKNFNILFFEDLVNGFLKGGKKVGVIASKFEWEEYFGTDYTGGAKFGLMYKSLNKDPSYKDFKPFGGWRKPEAKQYDTDAAICSLKMDLVYME